MPRAGTLVICVQNLDYSGANQVVLNIISGRTHESNVVVLSPKRMPSKIIPVFKVLISLPFLIVGAFAARFVHSGNNVENVHLTLFNPYV